MLHEELGTPVCVGGVGWNCQVGLEACAGAPLPTMHKKGSVDASALVRLLQVVHLLLHIRSPHICSPHLTTTGAERLWAGRPGGRGWRRYERHRCLRQHPRRGGGGGVRGRRQGQQQQWRQQHRSTGELHFELRSLASHGYVLTCMHMSMLDHAPATPCAPHPYEAT